MTDASESDWDQIESALMRLGQELDKDTRLTVIGSTVTMSLGQPDRMTMDIDVWRERSDYDLRDLRSACERAGIAFNPQSFDVDGLYLQLVERGIVDIGEYEKEDFLLKTDRLSLSSPPPENIIASKLGRCSDRDLEDCLFLAKKRAVTIPQVEKAILSMSNEELKERSLENLTILQLLMESPASERNRAREAENDVEGPGL